MNHPTELWRIFTSAEADLITRALHAHMRSLVLSKMLDEVVDNDSEDRGAEQRFAESDFAIPAIRALLSRFDY